MGVLEGVFVLESGLGLFEGRNWFPRCPDGGCRGGISLKAGLRILILIIPFLAPLNY